jgi:predicted secreted protein
MIRSLGSPRDLLVKLSEALGIDHPVRRICIDVSIDRRPLVTIESYERGESGDKLASLLTENYILRKIDTPQDPSDET